MINDSAAKQASPPFSSYNDLAAAGVKVIWADLGNGGLAGALGEVLRFGTEEDQAFRIPTSEKSSFGPVHGQFLPFPVVVRLPNFGSQCEEPRENYKIKT